MSGGETVCRRGPKKDGQDQAIGRSKGGLSTKIHLEGADALLPHMQAETLLADKPSMPTSA